MNKQEVISEIENMPYVSITQMGKRKFIELIQKIDEPEKGYAEQSPQYLKNILARLRELPLHNREVWLKVIISEFKQDFSDAKWREGYEQGRFESMIEREKVKIPQFVAEKLIHCQNNGYDFFGSIDYCSCTREIDKWLNKGKNQSIFARAWLDGYEVEKEKRYEVRLKNIDDYLAKTRNNEYHFYHNIFTQSRNHTRKELEEAGFGWVFDCPGIEVEEVK